MDHFEYPTFEMPLNWTTNLPINNYWGYYGSSLKQDSALIHLSKGRAFFLEGEYDLAIKELKKVSNLPSAKEEVYLMLGISYQALGNEYLEDAERYLKLAIGFQVYNVKASLQLAKVYYQQSKYMEAIEEYSHVIEEEPENQEAIRGLALSYFRANDLTRALRELQEAELMDPNDIEILYTMGIVFEEKHLFVEAMQYFNKVMDISPDSNWASEAIDHLQDIELSGGASTIEDLEEEEILMLIMTAPEPEDMPEIGMVVLLNDIHYEILPDDTLINRIHKLIKIMDERGKEASEIKLSYDSTYRSINIDLARVIKPDGTIIGAGGEDIQEVTPWADFAFYSNIKVLIISMPDITVGSIMEYQVTIEDIPGSKRFDPKEIDAGFTLAATNPVKRARINVSVPVDREFKTTTVNGVPLEPEIIMNEEMKHFTWRLDEIPGMLVEAMMPPVLDITPIIYVTSFPSWGIIADWWRDLEFQAIIPDDAIRSKVNQLTNNMDTQKDKARAIFHYVASQIRYVGLEYGKGAVRPDKASQVFENKYGDCKNKTILLITMLREAGINAYPALISTLYHGRAWKAIPRVHAFDHVLALCIIDDEWIWMDSTIET
jgi:tetratricopeptide (TPR) repeat protein